MGALDRRLYTSHHAPTDTVSRLGPDRVKFARTGCMSSSAVRLSFSRYCTRSPHPCTVLTAAHHIHTRPPDTAHARLVYQRSLMNTYCMFDLCRPRHRRGNRGRRAFTESADGIDLPGFEQAPSDMSDEDAPAARGGFGGRPRRHVDSDDDRHRSWRKSDFPSESAPRAATPAPAPQTRLVRRSPNRVPSPKMM